MVIARTVSILFRPYYLPLVGFVALFTFTYLSVLPLLYKLSLLGVIYLFTVLQPRFFTWVYRKLNGWAPHQLHIRENRLVPYAIFILSYVVCYILMWRTHMPGYMRGIVLSALMLQAVCVVVNHWWKISVHSAGAGGVIGALVAYSFLFMFNPVWWLCFLIILSGIVGTARMVLRQHSLAQVVVGTLVGCVCGFVGIIIS